MRKLRTIITLRSGSRISWRIGQGDIQEQRTNFRVEITGRLNLNPLQERNLLKGLWFVAMNTVSDAPDISGYLTLSKIMIG
ncbi:hypothetical protein CS542_00910 [Pedobacter sp. IW39]|nr:hypothetical protein CS542_00910 [Pedobacter sp. IW39]